MVEICSECGLPKELCVCESPKIHAFNGLIQPDQICLTSTGKKKTIILGLTNPDIASILKRRLCCGGTCKNGQTMLQGHHEKSEIMNIVNHADI